MEFNDKEILLFYKPGVKKDKNTYNLAKQVSEHINDVDITKDPPTETHLKEIIMVLGVKAEDIIERDSDIYKKQYDKKEMDEENWIKAMIKNPDLIRTPIAFKGKRGFIIDTPSKVLDLDPKKGYSDLNQ
ncbi:MAG: arsenate reductase family protein [Candidatus Cyclobacteriaceae bacterium M3_2C_046]